MGDCLKTQYICTTEYFSAIKRNEITPFVRTWSDPESIMQSEINEMEKDKKKYDFTHMCNRKQKITNKTNS